MNNNKILKFVNPIRSLKLRVFVVIMLAIIIPALASSIFIVNVTTKNYLKNRIDSFKANNTMLKNNIINNNFKMFFNFYFIHFKTSKCFKFLIFS